MHSVLIRHYNNVLMLHVCFCCCLFLDKELETLRGENRRNMVLSVALLAVSALFYYVFFYNEDES